MATGIVSNALFLHGQIALSDALLVVNMVAYPWLWLLSLLRAGRFTGAVWRDLTNPRRAFLFFTAVAATNVFAMSIALRDFTSIALGMWLLALALWIVLIYLGFGAPMFRNRARGSDIVEGEWLNAVIATQSLVIVGGAVALRAAGAGAQAFLFLPMLWGIGLVLYAVLVVLECYRFIFSALRPQDITPPLWLIMGAAAISVNAGSILTQHGGASPFLRSLTPFLEGGTLVAWAWATWWIPLLLLLEIWRHAIHRVAIRYTPLLWSIVFPLGMYATATFRLSSIASAPALHSLSAAMAWIALAAWCATALSLIAVLLQSARGAVGLVNGGSPARSGAASRRTQR
jgi:tellurite resistance protein TehA-like permease